MKKIVLTGGPCGGKSTCLQALRDKYQDRMLVVPEVATILLSGGFPVPGKDLAYCLNWQYAFQNAVSLTQIAIEDAYQLVANEKQIELMVCDRGLLDGAAYTPGGLEEFCQLYHIDAQVAGNRYEAIIHLESVATANPSLYGQAGNINRYEPLEVAAALELRTRQAWNQHHNWHFISGADGIDDVTCKVIRQIDTLIS